MIIGNFIEKAPGAKPRAVELVELVAVLICPELRAAQTGRDCAGRFFDPVRPNGASEVT